jgi:pimeloyl-ACP methyl ester carboxylesterase
VTRRRFIVLCAVVIGILVAGPAGAQDRPVVFLHGLMSDASSWAAAAERLRAKASIEPHVPSLSWRNPYEDQARDLQQRSEFSVLGGNVIAIGHSNGGIVAREWSRVRPVGGLITIGSPHRGAPLVGRMLTWAQFNAAAPDALNAVVDAFSEWTDWTWIYTYIEESLRWVSDFSIWSVVNLATTIGLTGSMPVATEMIPQSVYLNGLNASANLQREASSVPNRVGITSVAHNYFFAGPARAIAPAEADLVAAAMYGAAYGMLAWSDYIFIDAPPTDLRALQQSVSLMGLAGYILSIDPTYCRMVSRLDMSDCVPNDGLVPIDSQAFPDAPTLYIGTDNDGPAHTQETQMSDDALFEAMTAYMHVPSRVWPAFPPPPPPPDPAPTPSSPPPAPEDQPPPTDSDTGSGSDPASDQGPTTIDTGLLMPGEVLRPGDMVDSTEHGRHFAYQGDGNLVIYDANWVPLWASDTPGTRAGVVGMQGDGNLVIYDADGLPLWASGTAGHPGAYLAVQNDGNVVIYDVDGTPLWATGTF